MFRKANEKRIRRMWYIINCFDLYTRMKLYESALFREEQTYKQKEQMSNFMNAIFWRK